MNSETQLTKELERAFVSKHLTNEIRKRNLMIGARDGSVEAIKDILARYYLQFVNKLEYVLKVVAKKKIVTRNLVESAYKML